MQIYVPAPELRVAVEEFCNALAELPCESVKIAALKMFTTTLRESLQDLQLHQAVQL